MDKEKLEKLKKIILDEWKGTRYATKLFTARSDDFFIGYCTGMIRMQHLSLSVGTEEIATTIEQMLKDKEI